MWHSVVTTFFVDLLDVFNISLMILWPGKSGREKNLLFWLAVIRFTFPKKQLGLIKSIRSEKNTEVYSEPAKHLWWGFVEKLSTAQSR